MTQGRRAYNICCNVLVVLMCVCIYSNFLNCVFHVSIIWFTANIEQQHRLFFHTCLCGSCESLTRIHTHTYICIQTSNVCFDDEFLNLGDVLDK